MTRYASWGIIIDDIVFPDGCTTMGVLGGAGLYAAAGMRLWTPDVTLIAAVGPEFDPQALSALGLDAGGLRVTRYPTPRAWQLFEEDGRRTQIFRVSQEAVHEQLVNAPLSWPLAESIEAGSKAVRRTAVHYMLRGHPDEETMVRSLAQQGVRMSAEPIVDDASTRAERDVILRCLPHFELFSPDEEGAALLAGAQPALAQLRQLAALGPRVVSLRQGAAGSLVYERETDRAWRVPAAPATVVDITGAGNAYCGGFLVGWHESGDGSSSNCFRNVRRAAAMATVSAAITIEQVGPPRVDDKLMAVAEKRAAQMVDRIQESTAGERALSDKGRR